MCGPKLSYMDSAVLGKGNIREKLVVCQVLRPLSVPEVAETSSGCCSIQEADLGSQRRFQLAYGELKYFRPDVISSPKFNTRSSDNAIRSKSVSPEAFTSVRSDEEKMKKTRRPESDFEVPKSMSKSLNLINEDSMRPSVKKVVSKHRSKVTLSNPGVKLVTDNVIDSSLPGEHDRNVPSVDNTDSSHDFSSFELDRVSANDGISCSTTSLDSNIPVSDHHHNPKIFQTEASILVKSLPDTIEHKNAKIKEEVQVVVNSKRKFQHLLNSESPSSCGSPIPEMSSSDPSFLVEDIDREISGDSQERRKCLVNAAIGADVPRFKWGDLDAEDLEQIQVISSSGTTTDSRSTTPRTTCEEFTSASMVPDFQEDVLEEIGSDSQDLASPNVVREVQGFGSPETQIDDIGAFAAGQQSEFPGFVVPKSESQMEGCSGVELQNSDMNSENLSCDEVKDHVRLATPEDPKVDEASNGGHGISGLALLTMGEIEVNVSPRDENSISADVEYADTGVKSVDQVCSSGTNAELNLIESNQACDIPADNGIKLIAGEGRERFRQRLWCYLFENLNRAVDELYFLCELESDVDQIKEALLVLDEAGVDFKDLKTRVDGFERVRKGPGLPRPISAASSSSSISVKGDVQQRRPHAIAWEVRRMACSQEHADMLSSSLEALKKVQGSPQSRSPQGRRKDTSHVLSPDSEKIVQSEFTRLKESVAASRDVSVSTSRESTSKVKEPVIINKNTTLKSKDVTPSRKDVPSKSKEVVSSIKELPAKVKDGLIAKIIDTKFKEGQSSGVLSKSLNLGPPNRADRRQADVHCASDNSSVQGPASARAFASPRDKEGYRKKGAPTTDSELLTNRSIDSASKRLAPTSSPIDRFMSPTASSEQRAVSREKEFTSISKTALDAWKEKRNWEDILSSPLNSSSRISRSPGPGRKSTERVRVLHDKLMSPERKKKSPSETKNEVDGKQARATRIRMELENEKVQRLQRTTEKLSRVSEWQAVRSNKLRGGMHARQQRGESRHEAHLAQIARRASDESSKVSEVRFITSLNEENKKLSLQQKLQDSETRRAERLQSLKLKQKEDIAKEEAAQERRRQLEAERLQRIAEAQRRKEEAKGRREEERKAASAAREARAIEQVRKKEAWAKAQQEEAELLGQKLSERLRESSLRRKMYLEQIRERAMMDFDKQDKRSREILSESPVRIRDQSSPSGRRTSSREKIAPGQILEAEADRGSKVHTGAGLISLGGAFDSSTLQAMKKRVKKIRQRLTSRKIDYPEPPFGIESYGMGSSTVTGGARSKIGRLMQELGRLQQIRKPGNLSTSSSIISEMVKYLDEKEPELHAARQQGLIDYIATALPASHSSKPEASAFTAALLRLLVVLLSLPANRSYFIARNLLPPLIPMLSTALENFSTSGYSMNNQGSQPTSSPSTMKEISGTTREGQSNTNGSVVKEDKMTPDEKLEVMQEVLEGLIWVVTAIVNHVCLDDHLIQMQEDLADLVVACEVLHRLRDLFALFDRPQIEGAAIPGPVLLGLKLLETLTGPRGKALVAAHEKPVNILGRSPLPTPESKSIREDIITQKLVGVKEEGPEGELTVHGRAGPETHEEGTANLEVKSTDNGKKPDPIAVTPLLSEVDEKNQITVNRPTKLLLEAIGETGLVGLPSLLTAVLLQANPRSSPEQAASALPSNFEEVATIVLRVLNNVARLDLPLVQNMLALPDLRMEFFHLVSFLLSHCTCKWKSTMDQVAALLMETLLLLGYAALLHPGNQAVLRWGKSPTILHKMCDLPFPFFSDPKLTPILIGTLLSVCYGSERNRDVVQQELSMDMLLSFLKNSQQEATSKPPTPDVKTEEEEVSVNPKSKSAGSESELGNNPARGRSRQKHIPDVSFPSPKKPNRLLGKTSMSLSMSSIDGDFLYKESRSSTNTFRSSSGRVTPVTDMPTMVAKRSKGVASPFPSPALPTKPPTPQSQPVPTVAGIVPADTTVLPVTFPAALALQNRFPQSLWTYAEDFFSSGSWMGHVLKTM